MSAGGPADQASASRFLLACHRRPTDRTPIWLMRQAGRYLPAYRRLRERASMLELLRSPDLAAEVTLQPLGLFDFDAAIVFADILVLLDAMDLGPDFAPGEGPRIARPIRSAADVDALPWAPAGERLEPTLEAIRRVCRVLADRVPVIGFVGAPFTLACYAIEGGGSRRFPLALEFFRSQPAAADLLLEKLASAAGAFLALQVRAGARAVQVFDTWAPLLSVDEYRHRVRPKTAEVFRQVAGHVPRIHFAGRSGALLELVADVGAEVVSVGADVYLDEAWRVIALFRATSIPTCSSGPRSGWTWRWTTFCAGRAAARVTSSTSGMGSERRPIPNAFAGLSSGFIPPADRREGPAGGSRKRRSRARPPCPTPWQRAPAFRVSSRDTRSGRHAVTRRCARRRSERQTLKYLAWGWCATRAEVLCSGTISKLSVRVTPMAPGSSSSKTARWADRSGQEGYPNP